MRVYISSGELSCCIMRPRPSHLAGRSGSFQRLRDGECRTRCERPAGRLSHDDVDDRYLVPVNCGLP
jgi:hypothetical protein